MGICCTRISPCLFFFFNNIFFILGALGVACGAWILMEKSPITLFLHLSLPSIKILAYVLIIVGSITLLNGFLGCAGTFFGLRCFLFLYTTCLLLILACQVAIGLSVYFRETDFQTRMAETFTEFLKEYDPKEDTVQPLEIAMDYIQSGFSCCGWTGPENWLDNRVLQKRKLMYYPCSCDNDTWTDTGFCPLPKTAVPGNITVADWPVRQDGCKTVIFQWMKKHFEVIFGVYIALVVTEVLGIVLACCICKNEAWL